MPCGCKGGGGGPLPSARMASANAPQTKRVAVYTVVVNGEEVVTTTSPTQARSEAKRLKGSVRVSSRPADQPALETADA